MLAVHQVLWEHRVGAPSLLEQESWKNTLSWRISINKDTERRNGQVFVKNSNWLQFLKCLLDPGSGERLCSEGHQRPEHRQHCIPVWCLTLSPEEKEGLVAKRNVFAFNKSGTVEDGAGWKAADPRRQSSRQWLNLKQSTLYQGWKGRKRVKEIFYK